MKKYDLIVIGGGLAGVSAVISAARNGLEVLLIEKANCLGGASSNCLVTPYMKYWTVIDDEKLFLSRGIFAEIQKNTKKTEKELGLDSGDSLNKFSEEALKIALNNMVTNENIDVLFHSFLVDAEVENNEIVSITVANKSGLCVLKAKLYIDATGDGDLAAFGGCSFRLGREEDNLCQPMTLCFRVMNADINDYYKEKDEINLKYKQSREKGILKNPREDVLLFDNLVDGVLHFNSTRVIKLNPTDAFDLSKAEIEAREQVYELFTFLKQNTNCFKNSQLVMTASEIGVRESRMIECLHTLTADDLKALTKFEDSIAAGNYDMDIHNPSGSGTSHYYFKPGEYYTIPYRSLVPKEISNILVAGRCIGATHEAQASIRIMPIVSCLGHAAGVAASVAYKDGCIFSDVDVGKVQKILADEGAFIGSRTK